MSAPWGIKLNKDILGFIQSNLDKVLSNQNLDGVLVPVLGDLSRHQVRLDLSSLDRYNFNRFMTRIDKQNNELY